MRLFVAGDKKLIICYDMKHRDLVEFLTLITIQMENGTIKTLTPRGFGFITREGETKDLFFHSKDLQGVTFEELKVGDKVTFKVVEGEKGPAAVEVSRV